MKVKNISVKPICIGPISLLPGETAQVDTTYDDAMAFYMPLQSAFGIFLIFILYNMSH